MHRFWYYTYRILPVHHCHKKWGGWMGFGVLVLIPRGSNRPSAWSHPRRKPRPSTSTWSPWSSWLSRSSLSRRVGNQSLAEATALFSFGLLKMILSLIGAIICQAAWATVPWKDRKVNCSNFHSTHNIYGDVGKDTLYFALSLNDTDFRGSLNMNDRIHLNDLQQWTF